ncbi:MAG: hypothetical protein NMNS01_00940 [Nitrosomonas sp.]|nr:MAG: hypothetical protein NMNS01_00940 [Nitrosomonas sp.]
MLLKLLTLLVLLQFSGCSVFPSILYKIDVQQGNIVTQDMVDKLKPGMTKSQVRFVLGTPLIVDAFRDNRWDYVYMRQEKGELIEQESLTIFFENEILTHFENHLLSSGNADVVESREFYSEKVESPEESVNNQD